MMKKLFVQFFLFFIAGWCCSIFCQQIPVLDLSFAIKHPEKITLNNFVESITYIPLETTYDCLVDKNPKVFVTKEYIITITTYTCLVFNRKNGEFIREIRHYGRGPGEYQSTRGLFNYNILAYYFKNQNGDLVKYTMDGVFRGNIRIPGYNDSFNSTSYPMNFSFLNDSVIVCDFLIATGTESNALMIFDEKGKVFKLFPNKNIQDTKQKYTLRTGETSFYHFNDNLFFQNMYNDTVFRIDLNKITPYFILNRGQHSPPFESKWWLFEKQLQSNFISQPQYFENKRFISFNFYIGRNKFFALYDKPSEILKVSENKTGIKNDLDGFMNITFDLMNLEGELIGLIQANELVNLMEKNPEKNNVLKPELQKLRNIKMEDNPVIVIAKYRE